MQFFGLRKGGPLWAIPGQRTHVNYDAPVFSVEPRKLRGFGFNPLAKHRNPAPKHRNPVLKHRTPFQKHRTRALKDRTPVPKRRTPISKP